MNWNQDNASRSQLCIIQPFWHWELHSSLNERLLESLKTLRNSLALQQGHSERGRHCSQCQHRMETALKHSHFTKIYHYKPPLISQMIASILNVVINYCYNQASNTAVIFRSVVSPKNGLQKTEKKNNYKCY